MSFKSLGHLLFVWQVKVDLLVSKNEKKAFNYTLTFYYGTFNSFNSYQNQGFEEVPTKDW